MRDCQWANLSYPYRYPTDFFIKYNSVLDKFYYKNLDAQYYTEIQDKSIVGIWTIKGGVKVTSCFNQYVPNSLALYAPQTKAKLFWAPPPPEEMLPTKYRIWYSWLPGGEPNEPDPDDYYWISDVNASSLDFSDLSNIDKNDLANASYKSYYYIQAFNGAQSLYTTNIVKNYSLTDWTKSLKITNNNNRPRITWAPYNVGLFTYYIYKVFRKVETIPPGRPPAQYQEIHSTSETGYGIFNLEYTDYDFQIGGNSLVASYYVKATVPELFVSPASNIA